MALELQDTVLNQSPYWDDFDEGKNYHRVLFRPGVAVQARELTQLQTILQNQIERFGENIFKVGTVIKGCTQSFDSNYQYVKILDNQVDGQPCNMELYANTLVVGTANLRAYVVNTVTGLQTQDPDLNTLYVKYLNTGTGGEKVFTEGTTLTCYHRDRRVESIEVVLGGSGYSNTDTIAFTAVNGGTGAQATVVTYANGTIKEVLMNEKGNGYIEAPTLSITTTNGAGASLAASVEISQLTIANSFYTESVGTGYAVTVSDGIVFQKGHFVRFDGNTAIVSKYNTAPNNAVVGFVTKESVANTTSDTSLLDNASGALNYKAPGAHRLKLTPQLVVKTKQEAASNTGFFSIVEFENGKKVKQNESTEYNVIGGQMARRTFEESGNYVVSRFAIATEAITGNTTHINASVGAGLAYIEGHRVESLDNIRVPLRKATDTTVDYGESISTNYGNYVLVKQLVGSFGAAVGASVSLRSASGNNLTSNLGGTPSSPGTQIGTAKVRAVEYESGDVGTPTCVYRVYLFDVQMSAGHTFGEVRALNSNGSACADVLIGTVGYAVLEESDYNTLVFNTGTRAIASIQRENFIYRSSVTQSGLFNTSGVATITLSGAEEFPYTKSSTLNNTQERDFVIIPTNSVYGGNKTGRVQTFGNTTVQANTGSTTAFLTEYNVGESIYIDGAYYLITQIVSDSRLEVATNVPTDNSLTHAIGFPAYAPISTFNRSGAGVALDSTGMIATINLGSSIGQLSGALNATVNFNVKVVGTKITGATQTTKSITKNVYVKLSGSSSLGPNPDGPWSLGIPDVHKLVGVYKGTGSTYAETTDVTSSFVLDNGQTDNLYGLAAIRKKVGATINLNSNDNLLVKVDVYTRNSGYYLSAESYPVDDATTPLPSTKIRTEEIEMFTSSGGKTYDLRDSIDFRPAVARTANLAVLISNATVDPSAVNALDGSIQYFPAPNQTFEADLESYMPRVDRITLDSNGQMRITEGAPSNTPTAPVEPAGTMTLALVQVPPYPTLPISEARAAGRPDLATTMTIQQQRRYTMKDIQDIETRIARLEYYSLLNSLEQSTKNLVIPSETDPTIDRFKNGFFVDPFDNYDIANTNDPEYKMFIDIYNSEARPVINQYNIELEYRADRNNSDTALRGDTVMLDYTEVDYLEQPFATKFRNCVENSYNYKGKLFTFPAYDNHYDTSYTPQTIDVDIAGAISPIVNSVNEALTAIGGKVTITNSTTNERLVSSSARAVSGGRDVTNFFDQTITNYGTNTTASLETSYTESTQKVGDYVTNFAMQPYIRAQVIKMAAVGLRPGAKHYVFFDKTNVTDLCQPATVDTTAAFSDDGFFPQGRVGDDIIATDEGVVTFLFYLPAGTYMVGEREISVIDVPDIDSQTSAASRAIGSYNAYNFTVDKQSLSLNTKTVFSSKTTIETTPYVSTTRGYVGRTTFVATPPSDPIAQSFKVQSPEPGTDGVIITSIDLFFNRKDQAQGVVVEIRDVAIGIPTTTVLPNAVARVPSSQVVTSPNAELATTFVFPSPVYLKADTEYAFVVYPEGGSPEYLLWTGESGGTDVYNTNLVKKSDWGLGAMFLSTNGSTWTPYQFEDVKFKIKRAKFTSTSGAATLTPKGYEFLTIQGQTRHFEPGEKVAQKGLSYGPGLVYANTSSRTVTGVNTGFATYLGLGDHALIVFGTNKSTQKSGTVAGGTSSGTITGSSSNFLNDYAVGDYLQLGNHVRQITAIANTTSMTVDAALSESISGVAHYGVTPEFAIGKVTGIASATSITLDTIPPVDSTGGAVVANYQRVVTGVVDNHNTTTSRLTLKQSTASSDNFKFVVGRDVVGNYSQAQAKIASIDNLGVSYIEPHVQTYVPPATTSSFSMTVTRSANNELVTQTGQYGISNRVPFPAMVKSRSNEISGSSITDTFVYQQLISTVATNLSPLVDTYPGSVLVIENVVDNYAEVVKNANTFSNTTLQTNTSALAVGMSVGGLGVVDGTTITAIVGSNCTLSIPATKTIDAGDYVFSANEHRVHGISKNRYVSKRLALADGMDAEDARVLITAYRPQGTEVEVYAKVMSATDGDVFANKDWSPLVCVQNADVRSDSLNTKDYREFVYTFADEPTSVRITGTGRTDVSANTSNTTLEGFGTAFDEELVAGDFIKLTRTSDETLYDIRRVQTVTDYNTIVLNAAPSFTNDGIKLRKIVRPKMAFKYKGNDGIVRYFNDTGAYFDTYKYLAIKIVLRATNSAVVPTVQDVRAIATSI